MSFRITKKAFCNYKELQFSGVVIFYPVVSDQPVRRRVCVPLKNTVPKQV